MYRACLLLFTVAACEHGVDIEGNVIVSPDVQALYSASAPGVVSISTDIPKTGTIAGDLAVLCAPTGQPLVVPFAFSEFGCANEATITAWVIPATSPRSCGIEQTFGFDGVPAAVDASDSAIIFVGQLGGRCRNGEVVLDLILD